MSVFGAMNISATGMTAQQTRVDVISENIANVNTTRDADGNIYKRKTVVFQEKDFTAFSDVLGGATANIGKGVKVEKIVEDNESECRKVYEPSNPDADSDGYVTYPNVNTVTEMTNLIDASRSYTSFNATKAMIQKAIELGK